MTQYINNIPQSDISRVYTLTNSQIKVFYKATKTFKTFSKREIAEFLNQTTDKDCVSNCIISKSVEKGIVSDTKGIYKDQDGKYQYLELTILTQLTLAKLILTQQEYEKLFENEMAISVNLNASVAYSISKIEEIKRRFAEVLGFDPNAEGLCHLLGCFVASMGFSSKEDFSMLLQSNNVIIEQDLIDCLSGKKEQTYQLFMLLVLSQCLPALDTQSIRKRENFNLSNDILFYKQQYFYEPTIARQIITQEELEHVLGRAEAKRYIEFGYRCYSRHKDSKKYYGHSIIIYEEDGKYLVFDPNYGTTGFHPDTGVANLTLEEVYKIVKLTINFYSNKQIEQLSHFPDEQKISITLKDATLLLEQAERFYETKENPNSEIVNISVDKETGKLLLIPVTR